MADELPVTVNIVGNLDPLKAAYEKGAAMGKAFESSTVVKTVDLKTNILTVNKVETSGDSKSPTTPNISGHLPAGAAGANPLAKPSPEVKVHNDRMHALTLRIIAQLTALEASGKLSADQAIAAKEVLSEMLIASTELVANLSGIGSGGDESAAAGITTQMEGVVSVLSGIENALNNVSIEAPAPVDQAGEAPWPEKLKESLAEPTIIDNSAPKGPKGVGYDPLAIPDLDDPQEQMDALGQLLVRIEKAKEDIKKAHREAGDSGNDSALFEQYKKLTDLKKAIKPEFNTLVKMGYEPTKPSANKENDNDSNVKNLIGGVALPSLMGDKEQLAALEQYNDLLQAAYHKLDKSSTAGKAFGGILKDRIDYVKVAMDSLTADLDKAAGKVKAPKAEKPPKAEKEAKAPPPPPEPPDFLENVSSVVKLSEMAGVSTGSVAHLVKYVGHLKSAVAESAGPLLAAAAALAVIAVTAYAVVKAIGAVIDVLKESVVAAAHAEKQYIKLSGSLGSIDKAKVAVKQVYLATEGTGVDPQSILALHDNLSRRARQQLLQGEGLKLLVKASARLDPESVGKFGEAIGSAYDNLRADPSTTSIIANVEGLNKLGLISDKSAKSLEDMAKRGANSKTIWEAHKRALEENANSAGNADKSFGNLMNRLGGTASSVWHQAMKEMGHKVVEVLGPAFDGVVDNIIQMKPILMEAAGFIGEVLGGLAKWVAGAVQGAAAGLSNLINLFKSGDLGEYVYLGVALGFAKAANTLINALAKGLSFVGNILLNAFRVLSEKDFWTGIGDMFVGAAQLVLSVFAGLGSVLFNAISPMIAYMGAAFEVMGNKLAGWVVKAMLQMPDWMVGGEEGKEKLRIQAEGHDSVTMDSEMTKRTADLKESQFAKDLMSVSDEYGAKSKANMDKGGAAMDKAFNTAAKGYNKDTEYEAPDLLGDVIAGLSGEMATLSAKANEEAAKNKKKKEDEKEDEKEDDWHGQAGPKSIVDSLQAVGGGGRSAGVSIQERILEENRKQNEHLSHIAGKGKTADTKAHKDSTNSVKGAFGGGKEDGPSVTSLIITTNSLLTNILEGMVAMANKLAPSVNTSTSSLISRR